MDVLSFGHSSWFFGVELSIMSRSNARRSITPSPSVNFDHLAAVPVPVLGGSMSFICVEPRQEEPETRGNKDKGWAWVVCAGSFLMMFFTFGTHTCFGVFLSALLDHFKDSKAETAWVGSISINLLFLFSPITSRIAERYGVRAVTIAGGIIISCGLFLSSYSPNLPVMYLTYGLLFGIGTSLCGTMALIVTMEYFDKHLSLATGIVASGGSVGTLSLAPLVQYLLGTLGWQLTFKLLGSVGLLLAVVGLVFKPIRKPSDEREPLRRQSGQDYDSCISNSRCRNFNFFDFSVLRNKAFILWIIATSSSGLGYFIPYFFVIKYSEDIGIPRSRGSWLISYLGIASTIGRVLFGKLSDVCCVQNLDIYRGCMLLIGLASALCPLAETYEALIAYVVVLGLLDGSYIGLMSIVTLDIVRLDNIIHAWGILYFCQSFTYLLGPPAAGMICDYVLSYKPVFYMASASMILGAMVLRLVPCYIPADTTQQVTNLTVTSPNGTCTTGPPHITVTVPSDEANLVVEKLTSL